SAGQFNPALSSPITWMASIARNRAIDVVRKRSETSIEEEPSAMEVAADSPDPLARREMTEELKRLLECVGRLEPDRQKLVLMAHSEDHIALAAEYALGTLDADERAQVETMIAVDKEFAAIVQAWEFRLGVLNQMVGSVEPRPLVWDNIRRAIGHGEQAPLVLPEAPPPIAPAPEANENLRAPP